MKENYSDLRKKKIGDLNKGQILSITTRFKKHISSLLRYYKDPNHLARLNKKRSISVIITDINTGQNKTFSSKNS